MSRKWIDLGLAVVAVALVGAGVVWTLAARPRTPANLDKAIRLARTRRFGEAETELERILRAHPNDPAARLLASQIDLDQPEPKPEQALSHLDLNAPLKPEMAAMFALGRGKAHYYLGDYARSEADWLEALRLNPAIPEAGWALLDLYYVQGRSDDATALALKLRRTEPDPRDRILLLLELVRAEARQLAAPLIISRLERALKTNPDDLQSILGLGRALIRDSKLEAGLERFRDAVKRAPDRPETWDALLTGLDDAGKADEFAQTLDQLPAALRDDPRFLRHQARAAQNKQDWPNAVKQYQAAFQRRPDLATVAYRLSRSLRAAGDAKGAEEVEKSVRRFESAAKEIAPLYEEADAIKTHGVEPHPALYRRLADLCERLGRPAQAQAWYELVLKSDPNDSESKAGLERTRTASARVGGS